jgi:predicted nucleic acid-binding protein
LGKLGQLGLLLRLYQEIFISQEVYAEVVVKGLEIGEPDAIATAFLANQGLIRVRKIELPSTLPEWSVGIDEGEISTILLALHLQADWILMDDLQARRAARAAGLRPKGSIGVLLQGLRTGHLSLAEFELLIHMIQSRRDLWIHPQLCELALQEARRFAGQGPP